MIDANINNPKSPKYYVRKYLEERSSELKGKMVVDFPAGNGATSELLYQLGATVYAFDLFPQYFLFDKIKCTQANIENGIPLNDEFADIVICQEGIEHFNNVYFAFREFNRILKNDGTLIITTPSYSNIASKVSYLLFESETFQRMPPNEWDDVWMSDNEQRIYFGHLFLIGLQKLRTLATLSGFELIDSRFMRLSKGSLFLFPFFYPFILLSSYTRFL
ncbi:MAG: class I SAM-dependent methyltransferase, partial [Bacteroidales bacterium]|nr:class I SAM-dependent methyltransferase [Bacteroidales bacterium]